MEVTCYFLWCNVKSYSSIHMENRFPHLSHNRTEGFVAYQLAHVDNVRIKVRTQRQFLHFHCSHDCVIQMIRQDQTLTPCKLSSRLHRWRIFCPRDNWGMRDWKIRSFVLHPERRRAEPAGRALPLIAFPALSCGSCRGEDVMGFLCADWDSTGEVKALVCHRDKR